MTGVIAGVAAPAGVVVGVPTMAGDGTAAQAVESAPEMPEVRVVQSPGRSAAVTSASSVRANCFLM